jgi:hypothetical protein
MSLAWLAVGALVGAIGGLRSGSVIELVSGVLGGMVVLPIAGAFLGLLGGDAGGSLVGALGGLLGSWLAGPISGVAVDAPTMRFLVLLSSLVGATCLLYLHIQLWIYEKLSATAWKCIGRIDAATGTSARGFPSTSPGHRRSSRTHFATRSSHRRPVG